MRSITLFTLLLLCVLCFSEAVFAQDRQKEVNLPPDLQPASTSLKAPRAPCSGMPIVSLKAYKPVKQEPILDSKITKYLKPEDSKANVFHLLFNGIAFDVLIDSKGFIKTIWTRDPAFKTPEGLGLDDTLDKILVISKAKLIRKSECTSYVYLGSGWIADFGIGAFNEDGTMNPNARVDNFFKEDLAERQKESDGVK